MDNTFYCIAKYLLSLLLLAYSFSVSSQNVIDSVQYRAVYEYYYKTNPDQTEYVKTDLMYLDIGQKASKFYSRYEQVRDSVKNDGLARKLSAEEVNEIRRGYKRGTSPIYYQLFNQKQTKVTNTYISYGYIYEEPIYMPKWSIHNEIKKVLGYRCQKATTNYLGREWEVYFTSEIQLNKGPWKLWGLPGLILEARDNEDLFLFELTGFHQLDSPVALTFIHQRSDGKEYEKINKTKYIQFEKSYHENPISFIEFILGSPLIRSSEKPMPNTKMDYIPLEQQ